MDEPPFPRQSDVRRRHRPPAVEGSAGPDLIEFIANERPVLVATLRRYCGGDRESAADLAQEALARACRHWDEVGRLDKPGAWTRRVAINLAISAARRNEVYRRIEPGLRRDPQATVAGCDHDTVMTLRDAVADLPPRSRTAVILRYFSDLSVADTASRMGCAEGTVKALTHEAITRLGATFTVAPASPQRRQSRSGGISCVAQRRWWRAGPET